MKYAYMITERIYVHKGKSRKGHFLDSCGVPTQGKLKDFETSTKFKRPECTRLPLEELQSQKFYRRSMRPKLPRKVRPSQS